MWCKEHNISVESSTEPDVLHIFKQVYVMSQIQESTAKEIQSLYPDLYDYEVNLYALGAMVLKMFYEDIHVEFIKAYLRSCSEQDENTIENVAPEWAKRLILYIHRIAQNPQMRSVYKL